MSIKLSVRINALQNDHFTYLHVKKSINNIFNYDITIYETRNSYVILN